MTYRDAVGKLRAPQDLKNKTLQAMEAAQHPRPSKVRWLTATAAIALVVAAALCLQLFTGGNILGQNALALAVAQYPTVEPCPAEENYADPETGAVDYDSYREAYMDWHDTYQETIGRYHFLDRADGAYLASLGGFSRTALAQSLGEAKGENLVYSPVNVYMALALLCELTDGTSRQQIMDALGVEDVAVLREQTNRLWRQLYYDEPQRVTHLANSLWLNQELDAKQSTLDFLAENYFASSYQGEMGSEEFDQAMRDWANEQTDGLLADHINTHLSTDPSTLLALLSTVYFRARWYQEFDPALTRPDTFHNADGTASTVDFMHLTGDRDYLWSDNFSAISLDLGGYAEMVLILPDEGVSPEELLADEKALDVLTSSYAIGSERWAENTAWAEVELSMPKFDVSSSLGLNDQLQAMGITDVFSTQAADFTPLTDTLVSIDAVFHAARVLVDEEGCTATAIVEMLVGGIPPKPTETVYFTLDRPFLFAITGVDGLPLFAGVVNQL